MAPPLLPLCLELGALGESEEGREEEEACGDEEEVKDRRDGGGDDDEDEGSAPPIKLALLQVRLLVCFFRDLLYGGDVNFPWADFN